MLSGDLSNHVVHSAERQKNGPSSWSLSTSVLLRSSRCMTMQQPALHKMAAPFSKNPQIGSPRQNS